MLTTRSIAVLLAVTLTMLALSSPAVAAEIKSAEPPAPHFSCAPDRLPIIVGQNGSPMLYVAPCLQQHRVQFMAASDDQFVVAVLPYAPMSGGVYDPFLHDLSYGLRDRKSWVKAFENCAGRRQSLPLPNGKGSLYCYCITVPGDRPAEWAMACRDYQVLCVIQVDRATGLLTAE